MTIQYTPTVDPNPQNVSFAAWQNIELLDTMAANGVISGQTFELHIRDEDGNMVLTLNSSLNPTQFQLVNAGSSTTQGQIAFILTSANTGALESTEPEIFAVDYRYDIWRVDAGAEKQLTVGTLTVRRQQWKS